jgi:hypothetical protein
MTTQTATLTDFLLARIEEDAAAATGTGPSPWAHDLAWHARVLAECEAKRRIVADWQTLADRVDDQGRPLHLFDPVTSMLLKATEPWLRHLATVYADHPDYRPAWRP